MQQLVNTFPLPQWCHNARNEKLIQEKRCCKIHTEMDQNRQWAIRRGGMGRNKLASEDKAYKNLAIDNGKGSNWLLVGAMNATGSRNHIMELLNWAANNLGRQLALNSKSSMENDRRRCAIWNGEFSVGCVPGPGVDSSDTQIWFSATAVARRSP